VVEPPAPKPATKPAAAVKAAPVPEENPFTNLDEKPRKRVAARADDDDDEDDRPRRKRREDDEEDDRPRSKRRRDDDDEDDDRARRKKRRDDDEEDDDRPRGRRRRDEDDNEEEDDRPRRKRRERDDTDYSPPGKAAKFGVGRVGVLLVLISLGIYAGSLAMQAMFLLLALLGGVIPSGLLLVLGILGLANWVVGAVGLGLCIGGPSRGRGLAIAALSVAVVHLILAFITVNDTDSIVGSNLATPILSSLNHAENMQSLVRELEKEQQKNPGSARAKELREEINSYKGDKDDFVLVFDEKSRGSKMRWFDMTTHLTYLDKLIAILSYESKLFSKCLLGFFCGLSELARLILMALLLGSLARAAKAGGAASKAKLGWIVAASATGAAILVMLLCFVIADSIEKDNKSVSAPKFNQPQMPQMPDTFNMNPQQRQQAMDEYQRQIKNWQSQVEAENQRMMEELKKESEKRASRVKAPFRWMGIGEFLSVALHLGSLALPALAALQIYSATKSGGGRSRRRGCSDDEDED
jgi:hypothetical protein